jgi:DNA-binding beta-propeller fold protein YncE
MNRIFGILMIMIVAVGSYANSRLNDPTSEAGIEIAPSVKNNYLDIDVDDKLAGTTVSVSVFSSVGEIVLEMNLGLGLNKINVQDLPKGEYVAGVRENGEYSSKQSFVVS